MNRELLGKEIKEFVENSTFAHDPDFMISSVSVIYKNEKDLLIDETKSVIDYDVITSGSEEICRRIGLQNAAVALNIFSFFVFADNLSKRIDENIDKTPEKEEIKNDLDKLKIKLKNIFDDIMKKTAQSVN